MLVGPVLFEQLFNGFRDGHAVYLRKFIVGAWKFRIGVCPAGYGMRHGQMCRSIEFIRQVDIEGLTHLCLRRPQWEATDTEHYIVFLGGRWLDHSPVPTFAFDIVFVFQADTVLIQPGYEIEDALILRVEASVEGRCVQLSGRNWRWHQLVGTGLATARCGRDDKPCRNDKLLEVHG